VFFILAWEKVCPATRVSVVTSYDFRIGERAKVGGNSNETDLKRHVIEPGSYASVISLENVKLPNNVFAQIGSKRKCSYFV
jgi:hypothetical protein